MRAFISLNIDTQTKQEIRKICDDLKEKIGTRAQVRYDNPKNYHITFFFLGEVNDNLIREIYESLNESLENKFGELNFLCNGFGGFPDLKNPKVVFLKCENAENKISELSKSIDNILASFDFQRDKKFHPHITLARIKSRIDLDELSAKKISVKFSVSKLSVMQSILSDKGAEHKEIFAINL